MESGLLFFISASLPGQVLYACLSWLVKNGMHVHVQDQAFDKCGYPLELWAHLVLYLMSCIR